MAYVSRGAAWRSMAQLDVSSSSVGSDDWLQAARELAKQEDAVRRLITTHVPSPDGRCVACTVPGRGDPGAPFPCGPVTLARAALRVIESRPPEQSGSWTSTDKIP